MQPDVYYLKVMPKKFIIQKSIIYSVHPLNRYRLQLLRNSQPYDSMKGWVYAGNHNGVVSFQQETHLEMTVDAMSRTNFFTLKLIEIKYSLFRDGGLYVNSIQKQQLLGKHNLFIKKYISKFTNQNMHYFQQQSHISNNFILHYQVFIQRTVQGLNRIVQQHQRLNTQHRPQNRPRKGSEIQSIKSSAFSDKINEIEVRGENRFVEKANQMMQGPLVGSQSKLDGQFSSLNLKMLKVRRSGGHVKSGNKSGRQLMFKSKFYFEPSTQRKTRRLQDAQSQQENQQQQKQQQNQEQIVSPCLEAIQLKKLTSQEIKVNFQLFSLGKAHVPKPPKDNNKLSSQQKKRKLLQQFQRKRIEFRRRINQSKQVGEGIPALLTDRVMKRSSSTRSMRSVRLTEFQKLPEQKPWVKKQKQNNRKIHTKIMYVLIFLLFALLYVAMQPNRNLQLKEIVQKLEDMSAVRDKIKQNKKVKEKGGKTQVKGEKLR